MWWILCYIVWRDKVIMLDTLSPIILRMYGSFRSFIYDYTQFSVSFLVDPFLFDKKNNYYYITKALCLSMEYLTPFALYSNC